MKCSSIATYALIAIAVATRALPGGALAQQQAIPVLGSGGPSHIDQGRAIVLRSVTRGMLPPAGLVGRPPHDRASLGVPAEVTLSIGFERHALGREAIVIDVLVAYTKKAADKYADIRRQLIDVAVDEANRSFRLSNISHIRLRVVHAYQTDYVEKGLHFDHVWRLADKGDGYMEEVHALRDLYRADVVLLIVDDAKGCGLATRVGADANEAFAVVHHECAVANYTVAHEIGHLIGARHELGYVNGVKWRDIMSLEQSCGGCPRLPLWSSPTVLVNGEPAGTTELDNARIIAEQAARVAAFR